jgi:hypothetical protein
LKKFKKGLPCYLDEMDMMFTRNIADGSLAFIATNSSPIDLTESCDDDERADDPECQVTPPSSGTKRTSSNSTTACSPSKKTKSVAVRTMDNQMRTHSDIFNEKVSVMKSMVEYRKDKDDYVQAVVKIATEELGVSAQTKTLFAGLHNVIQNENEMKFFLLLGHDERILLLERATGVDN